MREAELGRGDVQERGKRASVSKMNPFIPFIFITNDI